MKTFYMHHYLCIVQCVDEKKKIRCTLLNIMQKKERTKIIKKNTNLLFFPLVLHLLVENFESRLAEERDSAIRPTQSTVL